MDVSCSPSCLTRRQGLSLGLSLVLMQTPLPLGLETQEAPRLIQNLLTRMGLEVSLPQNQRRMFVIDTGAERTSLSYRLVAELGLEAGPSVLVHGITGSQMTPTARLPFLDVSAQRFTDLELPVFAHDLLAADGLLGLDILSHYRLTLDLKGRRVTIGLSSDARLLPGFTIGRASRIRQTISLKASARPGQLYINPILIEGVPAIGFVDSGAQYSIGNLALLRALDRRRPARTRGEVRVYGVIGQSLMAQTDQVEQIRLSHWDLGQSPVLFADIHAFDVLGLNDRPAFLLGADVLSRFNRITLDYGRRLIGFSGLLSTPRPL